MRRLLAVGCALLALSGGIVRAQRTTLDRQRRVPGPRVVYPGLEWDVRTPEQVGLSTPGLNSLRDYLQGRGAVVRQGYLVYTWGDQTTAGDIASAAKPVYAHFLLEAVEKGLLPSVDTQVRTHTSCVGTLNAALGFKDRAITFRHMANQISCYGVSESPGAAFDYNDWQMALFWDTLFLKVYDTTYSRVDQDVLVPRLSSILQFQDHPTFLAFGTRDRPGRVAISPRDFCRFGLLYLRKGAWSGGHVLSEESALTAVTRPVAHALPRTAAVESEMCAGQRSLGSNSVPDDQNGHDGGYSWSWWMNGADRWPDAESNVFAAVGHDGNEGLLVVPCLDLVLSWNDSADRSLNEVLRRVYAAAAAVPQAPPADVGQALRLEKVAGGVVRLDWGGDPGPRGSSEHYHVLRGTAPTALDLVSGTHPYVFREYSEPAAGDPLVFYRIVAASRCEQESEN